MGVNMKMIQQMQTRLEKLQRELAETIVEGSAGGGMVKAQVTGARDFRGISIDPSAVDPDDVDSAAGLRRAALPEDGDGRHVRAEPGVPIERHDRWGDREPGPEFRHSQIQTGAVRGRVVDARPERRRPARREHDRPNAEGEQRQGRGRPARVARQRQERQPQGERPPP